MKDLRSCLQGKLKEEAGIRRPGVSGVALHGVVEQIPATGNILTAQCSHCSGCVLAGVQGERL